MVVVCADQLYYVNLHSDMYAYGNTFTYTLLHYQQNISTVI